MHPLFHPLYIEYCSYFNGNRDYFECHEVLEEYWKEIAPGEKRHALVGYIQVATGLYHWRRGNYRGAQRMLQNAKVIFEQLPHEQFIFVEKINFEQFKKQISDTIEHLTQHHTFLPFHLSIIDEKLQQLVNEHSFSVPTLDANYLMHKHTLRDRSDVIAERLANLKARNNSL